MRRSNGRNILRKGRREVTNDKLLTVATGGERSSNDYCVLWIIVVSTC